MNEKMKIADRHKLVDVCPLTTPYIVRFIVSGTCNFSCYFCPVNQSDDFPVELRTMLDKSLFDKAVRELEYFPEQIGSVYFTGLGETLLNKHLPYMISQINERNLCRSIKVITNASLLTPRLNRQLIDAGLNLLRISVEAVTDEGYKEISYPKGNFSYNDLLNNVKDFYEYSRGKNCQVEARVFTDSFRSEDDSKKFKDEWESISDKIEILHSEQIWSDYSYETQENGITTTYYSLDNEKEGEICLCTEPHITMNILPNGKVTACCADWNNSLIMGDLKNQTLNEIWNSQELNKFRKDMLKGRYTHPFCAQCTRKMDDEITHEDARTIMNRMK